MKQQLFYLENSNELSKSNYKCLRSMYLPLIGVDSVVLYELLVDLCEQNLKNLFSTNEIAKTMQIDKKSIKQALSNLEAVGLIKKFVKNDDSCWIIVLESPLSIDKFNKNKLLKNHLIKKIGINNYESIYYSSIKKTLNKSDYIDTTKKYQDVFLQDFESHINPQETDFYTTLDLEIVGFDSYEENIEKLPSSHFIKLVLERNATFNEKTMINTLLNLGFSDSSINLLIDYSLKYNEKIVVNYILTIGKDFHSKSILSFRDVQCELLNIESAKKTKRFRKMELWTIKEENKDTTSKIKKIKKSNFDKKTIEDVLSFEDMKEMF